MTIIIQYNLVCTECGQLLAPDWLATGLDTIRLASDMGWHTSRKHQNVCPDCVHEGLDFEHWPMSDLRQKTIEGPPEGFSPPMLVCPCGTKTRRRKGKCRNCNQEITPMAEAVK